MPAIRYPFEDLSLGSFRTSAGVLMQPRVFADGEAEIEFDFDAREISEWRVVAIDVDAEGRDRRTPREVVRRSVSIEPDSPLGRLIVEALELVRDDDIVEACADAAEEEGHRFRSDAAEHGTYRAGAL